MLITQEVRTIPQAHHLPAHECDPSRLHEQCLLGSLSQVIMQSSSRKRNRGPLIIWKNGQMGLVWLQSPAIPELRTPEKLLDKDAKGSHIVHHLL